MRSKGRHDSPVDNKKGSAEIERLAFQGLTIKGDNDYVLKPDPLPPKKKIQEDFFLK